MRFRQHPCSVCGADHKSSVHYRPPRDMDVNVQDKLLLARLECALSDLKWCVGQLEPTTLAYGFADIAATRTERVLSIVFSGGHRGPSTER